MTTQPSPRRPGPPNHAHESAGPAVTELPSPADVRLEFLTSAGLNEADRQQLTRMLGSLVEAGAALGWVETPTLGEITQLLIRLAADVDAGEASAVIARDAEEIIGFAYWNRYARPTHRPHVDIEKVAVAPTVQGRGVGRRLMQGLIASAGEQHSEVITLDLRADNAAAIGLYESLGFVRCGVLPGFVAVGDKRYDTHIYALDMRS